MYKVTNGSYPSLAGAAGGAEYCVGTGFPNGKCGDGKVETDMRLSNMLKTMGTLPTSHTPIDSTHSSPYVWIENDTA